MNKKKKYRITKDVILWPEVRNEINAVLKSNYSIVYIKNVYSGFSTSKKISEQLARLI